MLAEVRTQDSQGKWAQETGRTRVWSSASWFSAITGPCHPNGFRFPLSFKPKNPCWHRPTSALSLPYAGSLVIEFQTSLTDREGAAPLTVRILQMTPQREPRSLHTSS